MYVSGGVIDDSNTHDWIPLKNSFTTLLDSGEGNRFVYFKILEFGAESKYVYDNVYLNPTLRISLVHLMKYTFQK